MKKIFFLTILFSAHAMAQLPVYQIYGNDNRAEFSRATRSQKKLADSTG